VPGVGLLRRAKNALLAMTEKKNKNMIHPAIILNLIALAGMVLAYRNKALNERQTRKVHCEVKVTRQSLYYH
jgi:hypothetical protein